MHPTLGAEMTGVDVSRFDARDARSLLFQIERHGFVVIRKQVLCDEDIVQFSAKLGRLEESARRISHVKGLSQLANLTNLRDAAGAPLGFPGDTTDFWHSDQEFRVNPATLSTLYCLIPPTVAGATSFASTRVDDLDLDAGTVRQIEALEGCYAPAFTHDNVPYREVSHPASLRSPTSGRKTVYVSENTRRFVGLPEDDGKRLKARLLGAILRPANIYAHAWRMGDLIVYDNTQMLHRREAFGGPRWLKATKIHADPTILAVPDGKDLGVPDTATTSPALTPEADGRKPRAVGGQS